MKLAFILLNFLIYICELRSSAQETQKLCKMLQTLCTEENNRVLSRRRKKEKKHVTYVPPWDRDNMIKCTQNVVSKCYMFIYS